MAKDLRRYFSKDSTQVVTKHMRRHTSLVIRENKIKTKMMYHFILTRMAMLKKSNIGKDPATLFLNIEPREMKTHMYTKIPSSTTLNSCK